MTSEQEANGVATAVEVRQPISPAPMAAMEPAIRLGFAEKLALVLAGVIEKRKLYVEIANWNPRTKKMEKKKYVRFEGWTTTGALCGQVFGDAIFPVTVWTRSLPFPAGTTAGDFSYQRGKDEWVETITPAVYGFEAHVEARTFSGATVAAAEAEVTRTEKRWAKADDYAIRSMVQTRAGSKALRVPLGWIISLSGFSETPAEEMTPEMGSEEEPPTSPRGVRQAPPGKTVTKEWGCAKCRAVNPKSRKTCKECGHKRGAAIEKPAELSDEEKSVEAEVDRIIEETTSEGETITLAGRNKVRETVEHARRDQAERGPAMTGTDDEAAAESQMEEGESQEAAEVEAHASSAPDG